MELPFELPVIDVQLHWHPRFDNDAGLTWLRRVLVDLFERRAQCISHGIA
jgi:hypothetical protein